MQFATFAQFDQDRPDWQRPDMREFFEHDEPQSLPSIGEGTGIG
jgi:hypothetical protein